MMSDIPKNLAKVSRENIDLEVLRAGMIAELDAVSLYEQMAAIANDNNIKKVLLDIAKEEKTHMGEFEALLLQRDVQQKEELKAGEKEVKNTTGK